jgi:hypothetical protein
VRPDARPQTAPAPEQGPPLEAEHAPTTPVAWRTAFATIMSLAVVLTLVGFVA